MRVIDEGYVDEARRHAASVIFCFWHGRMLPLSYEGRNRSIHVLASEHRDGEIMGQTIRRLGFGHVRGSSTRGGARAIRELVAKLHEGFDLGITVDGPKGPRYEVKPGPIEIARLSGSPAVPVTTGSASHWVFSSWDAFELPKPFTRVDVRFGRPIIVPPDADTDLLEKKRMELQKTLRDITSLNDENVTGG
ncbi:MAG: lysophospholipid acyltransferase family protein [Candidatus Latescibacterota bacterium]|nr:MAG: lysophospholipid acyltransferase family protein [Candidatus Latescibacterota bacterium]